MVHVWVAVNFDTPRKLRVLSTDVERMVFSGCHIRLLPSQIDAIYLMASFCILLPLYSFKQYMLKLH